MLRFGHLRPTHASALRSRLQTSGHLESLPPCRSFRSTVQLHNLDAEDVKLNKVQLDRSKQETKSVSDLDALLRVVRSRANPAYKRLVPIRSSTLWSQVLLDAARTTPQEAQTLHSEDSLPERNMHESYTEFMLPFGSSKALLEQYTNAAGGIRTGKLMEHLDSLAGSISYKHVLGPGVETLGKIQEQGFYIVTASVDRLDMLSPLNPAEDLRLSGQVIFTGKSSMEVAVKMESIKCDGAEQIVLMGRFSMVCRDAYTHRARQVPSLAISTPEEEALHRIGEELKNRRQILAQQSLLRVPPSSSEAAALHAFELQYGHATRALDSQKQRVWLSDTGVSKSLLMFPQERNVHQKIFGGYLMRLAYELGFTNATLFTQGPVRFLSLDGISFARPVPIGSILHLTSHVIYSESTESWPALIHVRVKANVVDVATGTEQTTNDFRFTWCKESGNQLARIVVPSTYREAMLWLEGKRALKLGEEIRGLRQN